ncbi:MAG: deoxyribose-phosphate aldolase [Anaerosomatales bacterium]|nr:deoxyribose-phosphate aldolase [Anaerosomatales bacterium]MDI6844021.1 deoxyribose-phosphate aldolase [Anaerosomatales bacterium]
MERAELAARIDQTLLKPTVSMREAHEWMQRNAGLGFASLCVSPFLVPLAAEVLAGTPTAVCSVVGFPLGYSLTETKTEEARQLVELGCLEIDMVMNVGAFLGGEVAVVQEDVAQVVEAVRRASHGRGLVKVILETGYLDEAQIAEASRLSVEAGAHFVKTSTGFGPRGASVEDVRIMRQAIGDRAQVKAAGGIRDLDTALAMIEAGADRIGTSSGAEILAALEASARS